MVGEEKDQEENGFTPKEWLRKHYHVLERPIIEDENFEVLIIGARPERILKELCNIRL